MKFGHKTSFPIDVIISNPHRKIQVFKDLCLDMYPKMNIISSGKYPTALLFMDEPKFSNFSIIVF